MRVVHNVGVFRRGVEPMTNDTRELPPSEALDISTLSSLFRQTTNSYKYIFFLSLLDILTRRNFDATGPIQFREIIIEILANAWYPHTFFRLSFGSQDAIAKKLDTFKSQLEISEPILNFTDSDKKALRETIGSQNLDEPYIRELMRYVPYLIIRPFFERKFGLELKKLKHPELRIPALSRIGFETCKPLYCFDSELYKDCNSIILHPNWVAYLQTHYPIIRSWVSWKWLEYMQRRNPSVTAIANKLFPPQKRESLSKTTQYWKLVLEKTKLNCIYSGRTLNSTGFSLDHYLPWSFVAHDLLWNLIPTFSEINSSKSNNLPPKKYFVKFVLIQHQGLRISHEQMNQIKWINYVEAYFSDLKIPNKEGLLNLEILTLAYEATVLPLISLAASQGFTEWRRITADGTTVK